MIKPCRTVVRWTLPLLTLVPLAGCVSPTPLHIERAGTLPAPAYDDFDRQASAHAGVKTAPMSGYPEPKWVFVFDAPLDPRSAPLQIGSFNGRGEIATRVAAALPARLQETLAAADLFPQVTLQPTPHAFLLSGTVTRAEDLQGYLEVDAGTQVEATLSRDGAVLGAIQVNSLQIQASLLSVLPSLIMSAAQGSRANFVSERFADAFRLAATGARQGLSVGGISARFLPTPQVILVSNGRTSGAAPAH